MAEIENLKIGNGGTLHIVGNEDIVANAWQAGKTYVKNKSYVIREHRLYVCNVTHTSVEPFDATKWTEITIGDAIGNNIGDLTTLTTSDKSSLVGAVNSINEVIDISSAFVPNSGISNYDFFVRAYYNKGMKKVSGSFSCRVTSGTMGSVPMCTIDSDYRPSSNTGFPIIATLSGGVTFYSCTIGSNGQITQNLTSSLTGVFCEFEYYI